MPQDENTQTCIKIANELEAYADRKLYRCPNCGQIIEWDNVYYDSEECTYRCQECNEASDEDDFEAISLYQYISSKDTYDVEYRIDQSGDYKSVKIMIACGGPNIYIDTSKNAVLLFWWGESAECDLSNDVCNIIDEYYEEEYEHIRRN